MHSQRCTWLAMVATYDNSHTVINVASAKLASYSAVFMVDSLGAPDQGFNVLLDLMQPVDKR